MFSCPYIQGRAGSPQKSRSNITVYLVTTKNFQKTFLSLWDVKIQEKDKSFRVRYNHD